MDLDAIRAAKAEEERELLTHRQPGLDAGEDFAIVQTETNRRRESQDNVVAAPELPVFPEPDNFPTPSNPAPNAPDRWHKKSESYITVSKKDFNDTSLQASQFDNIPDAYFYAEQTVLPRLGISDRVVIEVHGGEYDEPLVMGTGRIDLHGIGKPVINNIVHILTPNATVHVRNFRIKCNETVGESTLQIFPTLLGVDTGYFIPPIIFEDCIIEGAHSSVDTLLFQRRALFINCTFIALGNFGAPVRAQFAPGFGGFADFYDCRFYGYHSGGRPRSYGFIASAKVGGTYFSNTLTASSGIRMFNCEVFGTIRNEGWMVAGERSKVHAGVMLPTGNFNVGFMGVSNSNPFDPLQSVSSRTQWDDGRVTSSAIFQATDDAQANGTGLNQFYGRELKHLFPSWVLSNNTAFTQVAAPMVGSCNVDIVEAASHCANWNIAPVNVNTVDCNININPLTMLDISIP